MSINTEYVTIICSKDKGSKIWDTVILTFPGKNPKVCSKNIRTRSQDPEIAEISAKALVKTRNFTFVPEGKEVIIVVSTEKNVYSPLKITPTGNIKEQAITTERTLEKAISAAKKLAEISGTLFVYPLGHKS